MERDRKYLCTEITSDMYASGHFELSSAGIVTSLSTAKTRVTLDSKKPIHLMVESLGIVTLFNSFQRGAMFPLQSIGEIYQFRTVVHSNFAISSSEKWVEADRISKITFEIPEVKETLHNPNLFDQLRATSREGKIVLFSFEANGNRFSVEYVGVESNLNSDIIDFTPRFEVEFGASIGLNEFDLHIMQIVWFFSFVTGIAISPQSIIFMRQTATPAADEKSSPESVFGNLIADYWLTSQKPDKNSMGEKIASAENEAELLALENSLKAWIERHGEWGKSYALMAYCMSQRQKLNDERVLSAARWLEQNPAAGYNKVLPNAAKSSIVKAAQDAAVNGGNNALVFVT